MGSQSSKNMITWMRSASMTSICACGASMVVLYAVVKQRNGGLSLKSLGCMRAFDANAERQLCADTLDILSDLQSLGGASLQGHRVGEVSCKTHGIVMLAKSIKTYV